MMRRSFLAVFNNSYSTFLSEGIIPFNYQAMEHSKKYKMSPKVKQVFINLDFTWNHPNYEATSSEIIFMAIATPIFCNSKMTR